MSNYVKLMEARKAALFQGDEKKAEELMQMAQELMKRGQVTEDEAIAGAYI